MCRAFCDASGTPINQLLSSKRQQYRIERSMRLFYRLRYTHHRHLATRDPSVQSLSRAISRSNLGGEPLAAEDVVDAAAPAEASGLRHVTNGNDAAALPEASGRPAVRHAVDGNGAAAPPEASGLPAIQEALMRSSNGAAPPEAVGLPSIREAQMSSSPLFDTSRLEERETAKGAAPDLSGELQELVHTLGTGASNLYLNLLCAPAPLLLLKPTLTKSGIKKPTLCLIPCPALCELFNDSTCLSVWIASCLSRFVF
jgi:hypothetical protein